ncbi:zinc finger CCCH domain-containing protein 20 [Tanacetum coccineum]
MSSEDSMMLVLRPEGGTAISSWLQRFKAVVGRWGSQRFYGYDCMKKNLEDDAGEILGVHSQGDCGNVTTDDNEDVTPVIAPEKDSIITPPSTPPDLDKRWSYRDPNGNIHGLFSLAQLRSWKDYFPSDLQIWSYYGNVKEAILLHNALSRQTKDAGKVASDNIGKGPDNLLLATLNFRRRVSFDNSCGICPVRDTMHDKSSARLEGMDPER